MQELGFSSKENEEDAGEDIQKTCTDEHPQAAKIPGADDRTPSQESQGGQRVRKLTGKDQELYNEHLRRAAHHFSVSYERWKSIAKNAKRVLTGPVNCFRSTSPR